MCTMTDSPQAFFAGSSRFYIRGVDYQPGGSSDVADPIADAAGCKRDISYFKRLGLNAIRVYTVDNTASHDECMNALADAGIYLILDVNTPKYSLNRLVRRLAIINHMLTLFQSRSQPILQYRLPSEHLCHYRQVPRIL